MLRDAIRCLSDALRCSQVVADALVRLIAVVLIVTRLVPPASLRLLRVLLVLLFLLVLLLALALLLLLTAALLLAVAVDHLGVHLERVLALVRQLHQEIDEVARLVVTDALAQVLVRLLEALQEVAEADALGVVGAERDDGAPVLGVDDASVLRDRVQSVPGRVGAGAPLTATVLRVRIEAEVRFLAVDGVLTDGRETFDAADLPTRDSLDSKC